MKIFLPQFFHSYNVVDCDVSGGKKIINSCKSDRQSHRDKVIAKIILVLEQLMINSK